MITVLLADDHTVVRVGLTAIINLHSDMNVVGNAVNGEEAVRLYRELRPNVAVMDLKMPGMGGVPAIAAIRREFATAKVLVLTTLMGDEHVYRAIQAGALGYLLKDADSDELAAAIRATHAGRRTIPTEVAAAMTERLAFDPLTARELDVLRLVARGRSNREIGDDLNLSENTVKSYLKSVASKLDAPDRTAAVMIALQRGLIDQDDLG